MNAGGNTFDLTADGGTVVLNLNLSGNDANIGGGMGNGNLTLREINGADFNIFQRDATLNNTRNPDAIISLPVNVAGDFDDLLNPPTTPLQ
jgi:hypothetical protein